LSFPEVALAGGAASCDVVADDSRACFNDDDKNKKPPSMPNDQLLESKAVPVQHDVVLFAVVLPRALLLEFASFISARVKRNTVSEVVDLHRSIFVAEEETSAPAFADDAEG
jgi:hypothetical protein